MIKKLIINDLIFSNRVNYWLKDYFTKFSRYLLAIKSTLGMKVGDIVILIIIMIITIVFLKYQVMFLKRLKVKATPRDREFNSKIRVSLKYLCHPDFATLTRRTWITDIVIPSVKHVIWCDISAFKKNLNQFSQNARDFRGMLTID